MRIPVYQPDLSGNEREYLLSAFDSSWISSQGEYLLRFEKLFAKFTGSNHAASVCNGTVALHLALHALDIGPGDEVIVPSFTYVASVNTIVQTGAVPVFADSNLKDWLINPEAISGLITSRTKAIMPVHLYGSACDMTAICEIANRHGLVVIEDCAEALGTFIRGRHVGTFGSIGTFSFFGNKTITTGEGGMVITNDPALDNRLRIVKGQGQDPQVRYWHSELGFNYRMTNLAAAIGTGQLERIDEFLTRKKEISRLYRSRLAAIDGVVFQSVSNEVTSSDWLVSLLLPNKIDRNAVMEALSIAGIETRPVFRCAHHMPHLKQDIHLPCAEEIAQRGISLPSYPTLRNEQVEYISECLEKLVAR